MIAERTKGKEVLDSASMVVNVQDVLLDVNLTLYQKGTWFYVETVFKTNNEDIKKVAEELLGINLKSCPTQFGETWRTNSFSLAKRRFEEEKAKLENIAIL